MNLLLKIITRTTLITALACIIVAALMMIPPKLTQYRRLEQQRNEMLRRIEHKKVEIKTLKEKQQRFKTEPEFVEAIARQNRRVRPGELVFVFEKEEAE